MKLIDKIKEWLEDEVIQHQEYECDSYPDFGDGILEGRLECAESLLNQIKKWEKENHEQGLH